MSKSFVVPWTVTHQATLSKGLFLRQEYWSWSPFPSPEDLSNLQAIWYYTLANYIMRFITQPAYHTTLFAKYIPCLVFDSWLYSVALNWRYTSYWAMVFMFTCVKKKKYTLLVFTSTKVNFHRSVTQNRKLCVWRSSVTNHNCKILTDKWWLFYILY